MAPIISKKIIKKRPAPSSSSSSHPSSRPRLTAPSTSSLPAPTISTSAYPRSTPSKPRRRARTAARSVWNSADDWDQLVSDSALSTSSASTRAAQITAADVRGGSLVKVATEVAVRSFPRAWREDKEGWEWAWEVVPEHLKDKVREGVMRRHGGLLQSDIIKLLFLFPPSIVLDGSFLPAIASTSALKPFHPSLPYQITSLVLTHASNASDTALAGTVWALPALEVLNLKGCRHAGAKTIDAVVKRCRKLKRINLKGCTGVKEEHLQKILDEFGAQLEGFKVDSVKTLPFEAFERGPFLKITRLCLPGDAVLCRGPSQRKDPTWDLSHLLSLFPSLTHLYLPSLSIPRTGHLKVPPNQLLKLSTLGIRPPTSDPDILPIQNLVASQTQSLRSVHLGAVTFSDPHSKPMLQLGLLNCKIVDFRVQLVKASGTLATSAQITMARMVGLILNEALRNWASSLKRLVLDLPEPVSGSAFLYTPPDDYVDSPAPPRPGSVLEVIEVPNSLKGTEEFAAALAGGGYEALRTLDISGSAITADEVFAIVAACPKLTAVDLTSCRGVPVRDRRSIFELQAYENHIKD